MNGAFYSTFQSLNLHSLSVCASVLRCTFSTNVGRLIPLGWLTPIHLFLKSQTLCHFLTHFVFFSQTRQYPNSVMLLTSLYWPFVLVRSTVDPGGNPKKQKVPTLAISWVMLGFFFLEKKKTARCESKSAEDLSFITVWRLMWNVSRNIGIILFCLKV